MRKANDQVKKQVNSHAGGMAVARPYGLKIDFERNAIYVSVAWFSSLSLNSFTLIFEIKIHEKNPWRQKNFIFDSKIFSFWFFLNFLIRFGFYAPKLGDLFFFLTVRAREVQKVDFVEHPIFEAWFS